MGDTPPSGVDSLNRYNEFLQFIKESDRVCVPTLDMDLFWHTHRLSPVAYEKYCLHYVGN